MKLVEIKTEDASKDDTEAVTVALRSAFLEDLKSYDSETEAFVAASVHEKIDQQVGNTKRVIDGYSYSILWNVGKLQGEPRAGKWTVPEIALNCLTQNLSPTARFNMLLPLFKKREGKRKLVKTGQDIEVIVDQAIKTLHSVEIKKITTDDFVLNLLDPLQCGLFDLTAYGFSFAGDNWIITSIVVASGESSGEKVVVSHWYSVVRLRDEPGLWVVDDRLVGATRGYMGEPRFLDETEQARIDKHFLYSIAISKLK
jgi:hypothetical protein